jgi:hypothetical protein
MTPGCLSANTAPKDTSLTILERLFASNVQAATRKALSGKPTAALAQPVCFPRPMLNHPAKVVEMERFKQQTKRLRAAAAHVAFSRPRNLGRFVARAPEDTTTTVWVTTRAAPTALLGAMERLRQHGTSLKDVWFVVPEAT